MLAIESNGVIALRLLKLAGGGAEARYESHLMLSEKIIAAFEAGANLMAGATAADVINRYENTSLLTQAAWHEW